MISFSEAVKTCLITKYATMSGRASRAEFWWFQLFIIVTDVCIGALSAPFGKDGESFFIGANLIFTLLTLIPYLCVFVRRLHDRGHSGSIFWWAFLISIWGVILVGLVINIFGSDEGSNEYGPNPNDPNQADGDDESFVDSQPNETKQENLPESKTEVIDVDL